MFKLARESLHCSTNLAGGGLGEPQSPVVRERVLNVEVIFIIEHSDGLGVGGGGAITRGRRVVSALRGDGNRGQIDLLGHFGFTGRRRDCGLGLVGVVWTGDEVDVELMS